MSRITRESTLQADKVLVFNTLRLGKEASSAVLLGAGNTTTKVKASTAGTNFMDFRLEHSATSGDNRGMYLRLYATGAGFGGEALRAYTDIVNVAAANAHGAHISLGFSATGRVTGLGVAMRATLHIPDDAAWAPGTIAAIEAEIFSDGDASDTDGATNVSLIRVVNGGNANGIADVDDDANLLTLNGFTVGAGNMVAAKSSAAVSHTIRINVGGTPYWLMVSDAQ